MTYRGRDKQAVDDLFDVILHLETKEQCKNFFDDLCTIRELEQMGQRLKAAQMLLDGKTYHQVTADTELSSATVSRISRCIQYSTGYRDALDSVVEDKGEE